MEKKSTLPRNGADVKVEDGKRRLSISLDQILVEELGQFGVYQARILLLAFIMVIFVGWSVSEYVFTAGRLNTRCFIHGCDSEDASFTTSWLANAIPTSGDSFDNCQRYANVTAVDTAPGTCPAQLFDTNTLVPCDEYVYESTNTVVYDFGLACEEWRRTSIGSYRTFGTLTALPITGFISDRWGRRFALTFNAVNTAWMGILRYWANTYVGFVISEVVEATFGSGGFSSVYILLMELVGPKYRVAVGATMNSTFSLGQITLGLIAWAVPHWRTLTLVLYVPMLITISYYWIMSESVRWLMSKGRYEESEEVLKTVARVNNKELSAKSLEALRETVEEEKRNKLLEKKESEPWLIVLVFKNKPILLRCVVSPVWWVATMFVYYGLSHNAVLLSGNRYVNYIAVSAVEIPGYWTSVLLMGIIGRKATLIIAFWVCAACQFGFIFTRGDYYNIALTLYLIGNYTISMTMTSVYVYTAELYPTKYRHSLFAFSSMIGRVGSIVAPLTPAFSAAIWEQLPFAMFGGLALIAGLLVFVTPETLGTKLPDTMEEACAIGRKKEAL